MQVLRRLANWEWKRAKAAKPSIPEFAIEQITRVTFYKRDQITTDLICCDVDLVCGTRVTLDEDMPQWEGEIERIATLECFDRDWFASVPQPPFEPCPHVAFQR